MDARRSALAALERACNCIDSVAYRSAVVMLTLPLPRWWRCDLARLAVWLDDRWQTGYWNERGPGPLCDACRRRTAWVSVGGDYEDLDLEPPGADDFMARHETNLCLWCHLDHDDGDITNEQALRAALTRARQRSIRWAWR
jgi:hypothetical protein